MVLRDYIGETSAYHESVEFEGLCLGHIMEFSSSLRILIPVKYQAATCRTACTIDVTS